LEVNYHAPFPDLTARKGLLPPAQILWLKFNIVVINHDFCDNFSTTSLEISITTQELSQCPSGTLYIKSMWNFLLQFLIHDPSRFSVETMGFDT
jgi:hypothetical protein